MLEEAVQKATSDVFLPVLSGTITTLLPFIPLAFWKGIIGSFMIYLPITLIITLLASLLVAYFINPVFAVDFMKEKEYDGKQKIRWTKIWIFCNSIASISYCRANITRLSFRLFQKPKNSFILNRKRLIIYCKKLQVAQSIICALKLMQVLI